MNYEGIKIVMNTEKRRFEMAVEGYTAFIQYQLMPGNIIDLYHTEVPVEMEGRGVAAELVKQTLEYCEKAGFKVLPSCPYVAKYIMRHPEWERLVVEKN